MTMEAAPTEIAKSAAICGSRVSAARTRAWLAKLATASETIARIGEAPDGDGVDSIGVAGFLPRHRIHAKSADQIGMIDKTYQPNEVETRIYAAWEQAQAFRAGRSERAAAATYSIVIPPP